MTSVLADLVTHEEPPRVDTLAAWWAATGAHRERNAIPIDRALVLGACADRLGFAFAAGYSAALAALVPSTEGVATLCATEEGGAHPRAIKMTLANGELDGHKKWATIGDRAASLLVVASIGTDAAGKNRLRPIAMTTIAAILALLPLAFALGQGSAMQQPLAVAIISGLIVQLPLVLLLLPVLLQLLMKPRR